jgi:acyl transferase domain-containing protein
MCAIMNVRQDPFGANTASPDHGAADNAAAGRREDGDIAIIGMACRFPGADDYNQYWANLSEGLSSVREVPPNRWDKDACYSADPREKNKSVSKWGGFVDGVEYFDADFFGVSAREAEVMDPQQRLMLEQAWACIEDAGYDPKAFSGSRTGVYIGVFTFDYRDRLGKLLDTIEGHVSTGTHTALIPNRVSYFLNLHGPSLPIDTACSSSLVALHKAAHAIRRGECDHALVGGVSVLCSSTHFISFSKTGMLSPDGSCKTFDERANGYVRGEGAAMVLIKPLKQAIRDGDRIAAVLRGSAVNHGGRARTVTYPGSLAQSNVIAAALREANVPVSTVNYVEAHGTGTPKGDPIEVEGLKLAFTRVAEERGEMLGDNFCGLGSVKTNVGHLESVAGMAGLIKAILCMRHQALPKLVHYQQLNPRISFDGSPFYIIDTARPWPALSDAAGRTIPRRAGISSFGFGGVNSHVVIEEYVAPIDESSVADHPIMPEPALVLVSAKTQTVLRDSVRRLLDVIASPDIQQAGLADFAYTLQVGRRAMAARLALVVDSFDSMRARLEDWLAQRTASDDVLSSLLSPDVLTQSSQDTNDEAISSSLATHDLKALAQRWIEGHEPDWMRLHEGRKRRRLALPTYPFVREKHWVEAQPLEEMATSSAAIHPLLHRNTSNAFGLRFTSCFTGKESFLADHVVQGARTLPGAAQLEIVRCAAEQMLSAQGRYRIKDVIWLRPIVVGEKTLDLHVALFPGDNGEFGFELFSGNDGDEGVVYGEGSIIAATSLDRSVQHDLDALRRECERAHLDATTCYAAFQRLGLDYGPAHRSLETLQVGDELALARIRLPDAVKAKRESYVLHPSVLDAALQATIAFQAETNGGLGAANLMLPFALGSLDIWGACHDDMWAVIRRSAGQAQSDALQKFDIDLCDETGVVRARLSGFSVRATSHAKLDEPVRMALLHPQWTAEAIDKSAPSYAKHVTLLCGIDASTVAAVRARMSDTHCFVFAADQDFARVYVDAAECLLQQLQQLGREIGQHLVQAVMPNEGLQSTFAGLGGMLRTAHLEYPHIAGQVIGFESGQDLAQLLLDNRHSSATRIRYAGGERQVANWTELTAATQGRVTWRERGVYLITGGAGRTASQRRDIRSYRPFATERSDTGEVRRSGVDRRNRALSRARCGESRSSA